jgi:GH15 family glucan-1,4-alpha-glucosidase
MAYQPIENYGLIGDMHTVALVATNGSIDWLCMPRFDSPSVFGALLDDKKGGYFRIAPADQDAKCKQLYWPDTNVLITRFLLADGAAELVDLMPLGEGSPYRPDRRQVIRRMYVTRGSIEFLMECRPAFDYARAPHDTLILPNGVEFRSRVANVALATRIPLQTDGGGVVSRFKLEAGESVTFLLQEVDSGESYQLHLSDVECEAAFRATIAYWRHWISGCKYSGRWREIVERSALALKLLTYEPTGAIVAAPTCSLPEGIGGERNWDYRYTWIRDSAFTMYALLRLGFKEEAGRYLRFVAEMFHDMPSESPLQIMYGIDGRKDLTEESLAHLDGYMGSRPVRVGNGAYRQLQLDIYGELLDGIYLFNKYGHPLGYEAWIGITRIVDWVCDNWHRKDEGIWEVRGGAQHFVYSKLMCWVAIDRALRIADDRSFPADRERWLKVRDTIYREIMAHGWNADRGAFVAHYGSEDLDAANLMMVMTLFASPIDRRMRSTLDAIMKPPEEGGLVANNLVYRYNIGKIMDGLRGEEGTFNICTFWLVEALTRAGRFDRARLEEARLMFERMLGFANHLGLFAEETGPRGEALGNYPQAFTHLALISAAVNLDRALGPGR